MSGIAYTAKATERGDAIIEWVFGHPSKAVKGEGNYLAYNEKTLNDEIRSVRFYRKERDTFVLRDSGGFTNSLDISRYNESYYDNTSDCWVEKNATRVGPMNRNYLLMMVASSILKLKQALYLEWALTYINKKAQLFALQVSEVQNKLAGIPTWMHVALENMDKLVKDAEVSESAELEGLKKAYKKAVEDSHIIAVGFDIVGNEKREFSEMIWIPGVEDLNRCEKENLNHRTIREPPLLVFGGRKLPATAIDSYGLLDNLEIGSIVEVISNRKMGTFRAHLRGFCENRGILGLGGVQEMNHKLYALYPDRYADYRRKQGVRIKGKFVLEVDERNPFGTLKVERVDSVEKIRKD